MAKLSWIEQAPGGWFLADGTDLTYLITADSRNVVLTRFDRDATPLAAARQAARNAIQLGGAYDAVPEAAAGVITHLKQAAQAYESGIDVTGQPGWWHGYVPH